MMKELRNLTVQELDELSFRIDTQPDEMAGVIFPDRPECRIQLVEMIGKWAIHQKIALENIAADRPHIALVFEKVAYQIWQQLPEFARLAKIEVNDQI